MQQDHPPVLTDWTPLHLDDIQPLLGAFDRWCLCGGTSVDLLLGRTTRAHGDTDVGVFRSDLKACLTAIGKARVFLCDPPGQHTPWDGATVPEHIDDVWITSEDGVHWVLQLLVFSDDDDYVYYKRDPAIRWWKEAHTWHVDGVDILNPLITLLYKANKADLAGKDIKDIQVLIEELDDRVRQPVVTSRF